LKTQNKDLALEILETCLKLKEFMDKSDEEIMEEDEEDQPGEEKTEDDESE
jgi:hypothetical protein